MFVRARAEVQDRERARLDCRRATHVLWGGDEADADEREEAAVAVPTEAVFSSQIVSIRSDARARVVCPRARIQLRCTGHLKARLKPRVR